MGSSTPYARCGVLWQAFERHFQRDESEVLVWKATTREMNPALSERVVAQAVIDKRHRRIGKQIPVLRYQQRSVKQPADTAE